MIIRPATPDDAGPIAALIASFQAVLTLDPAGVGAEGFLASVSEAAERTYLTSPRYLFLIAEDDAGMAGFIALRDRSHLFHLFVARHHQRRGVARALWREARARVLAAGGGVEPCFTVNASLNAVAIYRAFGFEAAGEPILRDGIGFLPMRRAAAGARGQGQAQR